MLSPLILFLSFTLLQASMTYPDILVSSLTPDEGISIIGFISPSKFGFSVKNAGDFNDDGFQDIIISAYEDSGGVGTVYVIFGSDTSLSDMTVPGGISSSVGIQIIGSSLERLGYSVSSAGDINADGIDDIIIGGIDYSSSKGIAYVLYGSKTFPSTLDLGSGLATSQGYKVIGASSSDHLGSSVSYAGDINNDGIDDVIIGAVTVPSSKGAVYVIFGKAGTSRSTINIASGLSSTDGFVILGPSIACYLGSSVSDAGDIDGDGIDDIILGAYGKDSAYIIYGKDTSVSGAFSTIDLSAGLSLSQGFTIIGATSGNKFGISVSKAGDFNGDGRADMIIGASGEDAAYVIFGNARSALSDLSLSSGISPTRGLRIKGLQTGSEFGGSVSGAGDINGDDIGDLIVGAPLAAFTGRAYVVFGSKGIASEIDLSISLDGYGIVGASSGDYLGASVSTAGDVNGDGLGDLIVGAYGVSANAGTAYLLFTPFVCPTNCLTCASFSVCLTCKAGYGLENSQCVVCPSSTNLINGICVPKTSLGTTAEVATGLFNSGSTASRLFTMGRSLSVGLGLMAKIIQNVRFLAIDYPEDALSAFQTYGTDLFELPIPGAFYKSPETKGLSSQYSRYDMEPSFLENYWDTIMMMLICLGCFFVIKLIQFLTKSQRKDHVVQVALKNIGQTFANYFIVQIYSNLDDVTFYLYLDIQSTKLSSASAGIGLGTGILFLLLGLFLVCFHCWLLSKYQQAKSQGNLERFEKRYRVLGTLYEDFKDDSITKQSFFGILILRCVILILIITLLQPQWMQATLMMLTNLIFLAYFIYYRPFKSLFDEIVQYLCELTIFAAYLCVLILSIFDAQNIEKSTSRNGLGKCIVIAGIVLALGGFIVQVIQLIGAVIDICKFLKNYHARKELRVSTLDQSQNIKSATESSMILKPSHLDTIELMNSPHKRNERPSERPPFAVNNLRPSVMNHPVMSRRISPEIIRPIRPNREDSGRAGEVQRNQVLHGPGGNQMYRKGPRQREHLNLNMGQLGVQRQAGNNPELRMQGGNSSGVKRRRIKREKRERRALNFSGYSEDVF